jgi:hypothetical protein
MFGLSGRQLLILLIMAALVFAAVQYVPPYYAAFQFNDSVRQEVKFAAASRKTVDVLRADILSKAKEFGIDLTQNNIRVTKRGPSFTLELDYRWPVDLKVYRHDLLFHISQSGELFENASD